MFPTKCLVCEQEIEKDSGASGDDEKGILPCIGGGTIEIHFGYFSRFDQLEADMASSYNYQRGIIQAAICDNCFEKKQHLTRTVDVQKSTKFVEAKRW